MNRKLIVDHDAGVDDLAAIAIAALSGQFQIDAITLSPADSFKAPAIQITLALIKFLNLKKIVVAASDNEGVNLFPEKWRRDSVRLAQIEELQLPENEYGGYGWSSAPAAEKLVELLSRDQKYEILATGPLSNIADALSIDPKIARNIERIFFMGGALNVHGNVEQAGHDLTAEWNVYNNPAALAAVLAARIPIVLVPLDATNVAPVTRGFMSALHGQGQYAVAKLFYKIWHVIAPQIESEDYQQTYFFWDTLTAVVAAHTQIGSFYKERISVVQTGPNQGQTKIDPKGYEVEVLKDPNTSELQKFILDVMRI